MKKILEKIFIVILMIITFYMCAGLQNKVFAAGVGVSSSSVDSGGTTTVTVSVPDGYAAFSGTVSFDNSKLQYVGSNCTSANLVGNSINVADFSKNSFTLTFKGVGEGTSNVSVNLDLADSSGNGTTSGSGAGSITVKSAGQSAPAQSSASSQTSSSSNQSSSQASAPKEPNFKQTNEPVYATKSMNVRSSWSTSSSKVGGLTLGQEVTRTGIGDNGWSRISYNGQTAYVSTSLITTTKPEETEEEQTEEEVPEEEQSENIEDETYNEIVNKIGTIPEVGNNINIYLYSFIIGISIISIILIFRKSI